MLAIRTASLWYQKHLIGGPNILLLTNDVENKKRALQEGIRTETGKFVKFVDMLFSFSKFLEKPYNLAMTFSAIICEVTWEARTPGLGCPNR